MNEAYDPFFIDEGLGGHTAEFEKLDLLAVLLEHAVIGIRQAGEGQVIFAEEVSEFLAVFGADDEDGRVPFAKLLVVLAQLRHVRAAEWSLETAIENKQDVLFAFVIRKCDPVALIIF